jgi:hypothetical protein
MFALNAAAGVLVYGLPIGAIAFSLYSIWSRARTIMAPLSGAALR